MNNQERRIVAAQRRLQTMQRDRAFNPLELDSQPTEQQLAVLAAISEKRFRYCLGGNQSGKSQLGGRDLSWFLLGNHPYFEAPREWVENPTPKTALVIGRTMQQVEEELWTKKLKPFFDPSTYSEVKTGQTLGKIKFTNGDTILFMSHHNTNEAREKAQSYTLHYIWLDEMPDSLKLLEELHRRLQTFNGVFLATFTPKLRNEEIRKLIDTPSGIHGKYKLHMFANPIFQGDRRAEIEATMQTLPEAYRKTVELGEWYVGDGAVYDFKLGTHVRRLPGNYGHHWRHIISVDPAPSGLTGLTIWGENPANGTWYCTKAKYLKGNAGTVLVPQVEEEAFGHNVLRRIADPHETWYIKEAAIMGIPYMGVVQKNSRKKELITGLQERLNEARIFITPDCVDLINEFSQCQWSETAFEKIIGARRFHLLDAAQYFADNIPEYVGDVAPTTFRQRIKQAEETKRQIEAERVVTNKRRPKWGRRRRLRYA